MMRSAPSPLVPPRPLTARDRRTDVVVGVALTVSALVTAPLFDPPSPEGPSWWLLVGWGLVVAAPLALRRTFPSAVAVVVCAGVAGGQLLGVSERLTSQVCVFLAIFTVGAWERDRQRSLVVRGAILAGWVVVLVLAFAQLRDKETELWAPMTWPAVVVVNVLSNTVFLAAAIALGEVARTSTARLAQLETRTAELAAEREQRATQAVALERVRIARELHDVVAHHVSVIGIQAGAARRVLDGAEAPGPPAAAVAALSSVEENARTAIEELRRTLMTLRAADDGHANGAPDDLDDGGPSRSASTLGTDQIQLLVSESQDAGTQTRLRLVGAVRSVPPVVGLALYRIAQEALTNVRKHAGPAAEAEVALMYREDGVRLSVTSSVGSGPGALGTSDEGSGLGHTGMRERAAAIGGIVKTGPTPIGYSVEVWVPLAAPGSASAGSTSEPRVWPVDA